MIGAFKGMITKLELHSNLNIQEIFGEVPCFSKKIFLQ